jgi:hypothetical protein
MGRNMLDSILRIVGGLTMLAALAYAALYAAEQNGWNPFL